MTESLVQQLWIACLVVVEDSLVCKLLQAEPSVMNVYSAGKTNIKNHIYQKLDKEPSLMVDKL